MKILYGASHPGANPEDMQKALTRRHTITPFHKPLHRIISPSLAPDAAGLVVFVDSVVNKRVLDCLPKLKFIATQSTGTDHIDIEACRERDITVCNVPGYGDTSVSELAILLLLGVARNLSASLANDREGKLTRDGELGFEIKNKTIGIIGTGSIGAATARLAAGFGMRPLLFDIEQDSTLAAELDTYYVPDLDELWPEVDIVSFHIPLLSATRHIVSYEEIAMMKRGIVLINTARGGLIDSQALLDGLDSGQVFGAGLDVLELEQHLQGRPPRTKEARAAVAASRALLHHPKVLHTMHLGAHTREAQEAIHLTTIDNLKHCIARNKKPKNIVA